MFLLFTLVTVATILFVECSMIFNIIPSKYSIPFLGECDKLKEFAKTIFVFILEVVGKAGKSIFNSLEILPSVSSLFEKSVKMITSNPESAIYKMKNTFVSENVPFYDSILSLYTLLSALLVLTLIKTYYKWLVKKG